MAYVIEMAGKKPYAGEPVFSAGFENHIMKGDATSDGHVGLHSLNLLQSSSGSYQIENDHRVFDDTYKKIYSAKVAVKKGQSKRGENEFGAYKLSSFFPIDMTFSEIKSAVTCAWKYYKSHKDADDTFMSDLKKLSVGVGAKVQWAGTVFIKGSSDQMRVKIWIGGNGLGTDANGLATAFPAVGGKFL